jgi:hypothetical protein
MADLRYFLAKNLIQIIFNMKLTQGDSSKFYYLPARYCNSYIISYYMKK